MLATAGEQKTDVLHSLEHEQSVIVEMVLDPESAESIFDSLSVDDFYSIKHQIIFAAAEKLRAKGEPFDSISTYFALREAGNLEKAGGPTYLPELPDFCPRPPNVEHYCRVISDLARKRRIYAAGHKIMQKALKPGDGEDIFDYSERLLSEAAGSKIGVKRSRRRFELLEIRSIKIALPEFIVRRLLEANTLFQIFGDPGTCKSLIAISMLSCIATHTHFYGLKVKQGPVIYIPDEGQSGIRRRFEAWSIVNHVPLDDAPIFVSSAPIGLCDDLSVEIVLKTIAEIAEKAGPPILIIIDTLARNFGPGDENSTSDMTKAIAAADRIRELYGSSVGLIHHSGVGDKNRGRGNSALKGAVDAEYRMERDPFGTIHFEATKMKDAEFPDPMAFKLSVVELGIEDDDGNEVTSVVLRQVDDNTPVQNPNAGLGKNQAKGIHILMELYQAHRENVEKSGRDPESARVLIEDWSTACKESGMDRQAFYKIKKSMIEKKMIRVDDPFVYPSPL